MSLELDASQIKSALHGISVPPQPQIMVDLQMEQMDPHCSLARITDLISRDVGLSGAVIKIVNSKNFGGDHKVTSVTEAVNRLGAETVINIVNALSIRDELSDEFISSMGRFWDTASDIASISATIAKHINYRSPDEAYTLGLFHNCGIPLLMRRFYNYREIIQRAYGYYSPESRIIDTENKTINTNHAVVGYYVGKSWHLPDYMCDAIAEHHNTYSIFTDQDYPHTERKNLLAILKAAEHIAGCYNMLGRQKEDKEWEHIQDLVLPYIGLSQYDFQNILESCHEQGLGGRDANYIYRD